MHTVTQRHLVPKIMAIIVYYNINTRKSQTLKQQEMNVE